MNIRQHKIFTKRSELKAYQLRELNALLARAYARNAFYKTLYRKHGVAFPRRIRSWEEYDRLPLLTKQDLQEDQAKHPPIGTNRSIPEAAGYKLRFTSGTTGKPLYIPESIRDMETKTKMLAKKFHRLGVGPKDRVLMLWSADMYEFHVKPFLALGATVLAMDIRSNKSAIDLIIANRVTTVCMIPSLAVSLMAIAKQHRINLRQTSLKRIFLTGEPGGEDPVFKKRLGEAYNCRVLNMSGSSETDQIQSECLKNPGFNHLAEEYLIMDVIDPQTLKPADRGELIVTTIWKKDYPLIRYRTGDIVEIDTKPCICGDSTRLIKRGILGRIGRSFKMNGIPIYLSTVESIIKRQLTITDYGIKIFRSTSGDYLSIYIKTADRRSVDVKRLKQELEDHLGNIPVIKFTGAQMLDNSLWKTNKVIDVRNTFANALVDRFPFVHRFL